MSSQTRVFSAASALVVFLFLARVGFAHGEPTSYHDPNLGFSFKIPGGWDLGDYFTFEDGQVRKNLIDLEDQASFAYVWARPTKLDPSEIDALLRERPASLQESRREAGSKNWTIRPESIHRFRIGSLEAQSGVADYVKKDSGQHKVEYLTWICTTDIRLTVFAMDIDPPNLDAVVARLKPLVDSISFDAPGKAVAAQGPWAPPLSSALVTVPGTSNPWLAGMPAGSQAGCFLVGRLCDSVPGQSPVQVPRITLVPGTFLTFSATGAVSSGPCCALVGPDGAPPTPFSRGTGSPQTVPAQNGIRGVSLPRSSLVGVFLGSERPDLSPPPDPGPAAAPAVKQVFLIGSHAEVKVPQGATRLYLGTMDGYNWANNFGQFGVMVSPESENATTPPVGNGKGSALAKPVAAKQHAASARTHWYKDGTNWLVAGAVGGFFGMLGGGAYLLDTAPQAHGLSTGRLAGGVALAGIPVGLLVCVAAGPCSE
jgi:hypothetical protein